MINKEIPCSKNTVNCKILSDFCVEQLDLPDSVLYAVYLNCTLSIRDQLIARLSQTGLIYLIVDVVVGTADT